MSTLLDTNILARLAQPDHPQHRIARDSVRTLLERREELYVVPQNLYEFWVVATRPVLQNGLGMTVAETQGEIAQIKRLFSLLSDERGIFAEWERLAAFYDLKGKAAHDARLVAAIHLHGLTQLLTFNAGHFTRFQDISVLKPETVVPVGG